MSPKSKKHIVLLLLVAAAHRRVVAMLALSSLCHLTDCLAGLLCRPLYSAFTSLSNVGSPVQQVQPQHDVCLGLFALRQNQPCQSGIPHPLSIVSSLALASFGLDAGYGVASSSAMSMVASWSQIKLLLQEVLKQLGDPIAAGSNGLRLVESYPSRMVRVGASSRWHVDLHGELCGILIFMLHSRAPALDAAMLRIAVFACSAHGASAHVAVVLARLLSCHDAAGSRCVD